MGSISEEELVAAALPEIGKPVMEKWLDSSDKVILWIMKENLKKNCLVKVDAAWVDTCMKKLDSSDEFSRSALDD